MFWYQGFYWIIHVSCRISLPILFYLIPHLLDRESLFYILVTTLGSCSASWEERQTGGV